MRGRYLIGSASLTELQINLSSILTQVSYLDSLSFGKTADFIASLDSIVKYVTECRNICNKATLL